MKSLFNKNWNKSKQPRKQVKFRANAPNHIKRKFLSAALDKVLREKFNRRSIELKKGDEVKIMRGKFKGKSGKVSVVDTKNSRIQVEGAQRQKKGGEKLETWFNASNVKIITLENSDSKRLKSKVTKTESKAKAKEEKTPSKENKSKEEKK